MKFKKNLLFWNYWANLNQILLKWFLDGPLPKLCPVITTKIKKKKNEHMLNYSLPCSCSSNLSSFWLILKQQWTIEEISIFSNTSHLEWRVGLSDTIFKGNHPGTIPARFGLIWFSGFRGEDLNAIFYQRWPPSKIVSGDHDFQPRWPPSSK
jgi:hypothetical protein